MLTFRPRTPKRLLVRDVAVLDPEDGGLAEHHDLLLEGGRIDAIAPHGELPAAGATIIDGAGHFAVPGLIDCHLHLCGTYQLEPPSPGELLDVPGQVAKNLRATLLSGVTTARDMGAPLKMATWLRQRAAEGRIEAPRILTPGPVLTAPRGYPAFIEELPPALAWAIGQIKVGVAEVGQARQWVDRLAEHGVDHVKVIFTSEDYDDARSPLPLLDGEVLRAITERAHHHNLPVAAHHVWLRDLGPLLELPFDSLEHITIDGVVSDAHLERMRARDLPVTSTFMTYGILDFIDELAGLLETRGEVLMERRALGNVRAVVGELRSGAFVRPEFGRKTIETGMSFMLQNLSRLREAGVRVGAGTDAGGAITPCGRIAWELRSFVRGGYTPLEALRAATTEAARIVGLPELGRLAPGRPADLILCPANPALDVRALEDVDVVIRDGIVFKNNVGTVKAELS